MHETPSNWHISPNCLQNISNIYKFNWHFPPNLPAKKSGLNLPGPNLPRTLYHIVYLCICSYICVQRITLKHCQSASHLTLLSSITICATINFYEPKYYQLRWKLFKFWCATTGAQPATNFTQAKTQQSQQPQNAAIISKFDSVPQCGNMWCRTFKNVWVVQ